MASNLRLREESRAAWRRVVAMGDFFDEVLIMIYQNNIASYSQVALSDSAGENLSFTKD